MADRVSPQGPPPLDTRAIRRRVQRDYVLVSAPASLDADTARHLLGRFTSGEENADVVLDLRAVERCHDESVGVLVQAARQLDREGLTLTLSHPSPAFEQALVACSGEQDLTVRRATGR